MYLVDLKSEKHEIPRLCLHGRLESVTEIKYEISELLEKANDSKSIIIDMGGVISMSEEFLEMLADINSKFETEYVGYSMFIEDQLKKYNII